jgi:transposase
MKSYSEDLRERIVEAVADGMSKSEAARQFKVSLNSVKRYVKLKQTSGGLKPLPRPGQTVTIKGEKVALLLEQIKASPDATLQERAGLWEQSEGVKLSRSTFSRALKRLKITYKKKPKSERRG